MGMGRGEHALASLGLGGGEACGGLVGALLLPVGGVGGLGGELRVVVARAGKVVARAAEEVVGARAVPDMMWCGVVRTRTRTCGTS